MTCSDWAESWSAALVTCSAITRASLATRCTFSSRSLAIRSCSLASPVAASARIFDSSASSCFCAASSIFVRRLATIVSMDSFMTANSAENLPSGSTSRLPPATEPAKSRIRISGETMTILTRNQAPTPMTARMPSVLSAV